jgi:hypothetical protein
MQVAGFMNGAAVMAGLVPAIYGYAWRKLVDGRDKPGHDEGWAPQLG